MIDTTSATAHWQQALLDTYPVPPVEFVEGKGSWLIDASGTHHIDMLSGIAVNALGHAHPAVVEAVHTQMTRLGHVSNLFASAPVVDVARELQRRVGDESARVFFCNSGAEANEAAFKLARLTGRGRILAAEHGFHGRTMGSLALTGQPAKRAPFEPMPAGVEFYPYGDIDALTALVERAPEDTAAIFLEPIQGETGVIPAPEGFLRQVRGLCDAHGVLMVCDEVQTGVGRTGDFFAFQHDGVLPDVITMAKGLGGGLPIGATIARGKAATLFTPGAHGTTFGGNPISCAAARAVLNVVDDAFIADVARKGQLLSAAVGQVTGVSEVRGRGLMLGVVLEQPVAKQTVAAGLHHGIILNAPSESVIRLTPPLVIKDDEIREAAGRFAASLNDALGKGESTDA